jgi:hypothetical protein
LGVYEAGFSGHVSQARVKRFSGTNRACANPERFWITVLSAAATGRVLPSSRATPHTAGCWQGSSSTIW